MQDLASVTYYEDPRVKFARTVDSFAHAGPSGIGAFAGYFPDWLRWKRRADKVVETKLGAMKRGAPPDVQVTQHHRAHAASAFYPSPFQKAAVLCVDSVGERHSTTIWHGDGAALSLVNSVSYPHSIGLLYSAFTQFCGFKVDSGEYKLMGLAPYGRPIHAQKIKDSLIEMRPDGSYALNLEHFSFLQGRTIVGDGFEKLFQRAMRNPESELTQDDCDLAASIQQVTTEVVLGLARAAKDQTDAEYLCLAGGVSLNCVANGALMETGMFKDLWVQPAGGDAGCALGAALDRFWRDTGQTRDLSGQTGDGMHGSLLGPGFEADEIQAFVQSNGYPVQQKEDAELFETVSTLIADGGVVGWFDGRMEFGPRALGARSILGDPRSGSTQKVMNLKIKFRESFRPFAPSVLAEQAQSCFGLSVASDYMSFVVPVAESLCDSRMSCVGLGSLGKVQSDIPAVTHVDYSARVQTVGENASPRYRGLIETFARQTGTPLLVNTSFNVRGEPIVCTPEDAYRCFMRTEMDALVLGNCLLMKADQPDFEDTEQWRETIPLD
jgi:carbamoyltransferase